MKATDREGVWIEDDVFPGIDMIVDCNEVNNVPSIPVVIKGIQNQSPIKYLFENGVRISDVEAVKAACASYYLNRRYDLQAG
jgi:hypothetical protein